MDDIFARIEAEYCPPLDPALVSAILLDYDLANSEDLGAAKRTLDELKDDAILNEAVAFDPSGTGAGAEDTIVQDPVESHVGTSTSQSRESDATSLTNGISSIGFDDELTEPELGYEDDEEVHDFDQLDEGAKIRRLQAIFGEHISRYSVQHTLRKYNGKWNATVDDLLSQASFVDAGNLSGGEVVVAKGIDGFTEEQLLRRGRKGRTKTKKPRNLAERRTSSLPGSYEASPTATKNTWKDATEDVDFIASRTGIASTKVSSMYYANGASVSQTITAILRLSMEDRPKVAISDTVLSTQTTEMKSDFPTIPTDFLQTLIKIAYPLREAAHELAMALISRPRNLEGGGIHIIPHFAPLEGLADDPDFSELTWKAKSATSSRSTSLDVVSSAARRDAYAQAQALAFAKARAAHRKAKSDRLMGGAAAYYGQEGRDYAALLSNAASKAADSLVASQSTPKELDLHGVDVANAVRIAQEKVMAWWNNLGENRINGRVGAEDRLAGYRIVVGLGKHSEGGRSKLGPAVTKMLKQEGWRTESTGAVITVRGPAKR